MTTYVAFLRAINVAGHAIVRMTDLCERFTAAGCRNVRSYIQSGNVVFESSSRSESAVLHELQRELRELLDDVPQIMLRELGQMDALIERAPFKNIRTKPPVKLYVSFLGEAPRSRPRFPLVSTKEALRAIGMSGREVFIVSGRKPNGFFGFPNNFIEKELDVVATTRNWSTVTKTVDFARRHP
jgi:uncharacterized protein (DUF1697 family)